jgi:transposase
MKKTEFKQGVVKIGSGLPVLHPHAAGIDIGSAFHCIAIPNGTGGHEVQTIGAFTRDLREIVGYLLAHGITTVAMESTGIYWLPLYLMLEEAGIEVYLVTAKHVKNVKGRKKDDTDAIWIQKLHTCGLLEKSFQPESEQRLLRSYTRQRKVLIQVGADCIRRLQRALELMNVKWANVLSDSYRECNFQFRFGFFGAVFFRKRNDNPFARPFFGIQARFRCYLS